MDESDWENRNIILKKIRENLKTEKGHMLPVSNGKYKNCSNR